MSWDQVDEGRLSNTEGKKKSVGEIIRKWKKGTSAELETGE